MTDKEIIFDIINEYVNGVDTYHNNGSMWFIFTDDRKWVIELTKEGTLWYNFYFFQDCFKYLSLDVVENQHYITEWVEDTIQNGVRNTHIGKLHWLPMVEDAIQNGVKEIHWVEYSNLRSVEDTIQNGVKYTSWHEPILLGAKVEDDIQNGIKETKLGAPDNRDYFINDTIQNGIKETNWRKVDNHPTYVDHVINPSHHGTKQTLVV